MNHCLFSKTGLEVLFPITSFEVLFSITSFDVLFTIICRTRIILGLFSYYWYEGTFFDQKPESFVIQWNALKS